MRQHRAASRRPPSAINLAVPASHFFAIVSSHPLRYCTLQLLYVAFGFRACTFSGCAVRPSIISRGLVPAKASLCRDFRTIATESGHVEHEPAQFRWTVLASCFVPRLSLFSFRIREHDKMGTADPNPPPRRTKLGEPHDNASNAASLGVRLGLLINRAVTWVVARLCDNSRRTPAFIPEMPSARPACRPSM